MDSQLLIIITRLITPFFITLWIFFLLDFKEPKRRLHLQSTDFYISFSGDFSTIRFAVSTVKYSRLRQRLWRKMHAPAHMPTSGFPYSAMISSTI